ncbi:MAG: triose-phosphate isomerase [Patescibacteria group bacterium]
MIFVNFKTYREASGKSAVSLAQTIKDVAENTRIEIISCPQAVDLKEVVEVSKHPPWVQHVDPVERGRATGWIPAEIAKEKGAEGALLNHSEHKLSVGQLGETLQRCKNVGLQTLVFADSVEEAKVVAKFKPDYIGYEPPELVGSKTTSVAQSKPDVIEKVVKAVLRIPIIVGAGVKGKSDVEVGLKRGAKGVALASALVKATNPKNVLEDLVGGFK